MSKSGGGLGDLLQNRCRNPGQLERCQKELLREFAGNQDALKALAKLLGRRRQAVYRCIETKYDPSAP